MKQRKLSAAILEAGVNMQRNSAAIPGRPGRDYPSAGAGDPPERHEHGQDTPVLSPTEDRILRILFDPDSRIESNRELAEELGITPGAVKQHLHRMYRHLSIKSSRGLFRLGFRSYLALHKKINNQS